jgi:hypothetical protein
LSLLRFSCTARKKDHISPSEIPVPSQFFEQENSEHCAVLAKWCVAFDEYDLSDYRFSMFLQTDGAEQRCGGGDASVSLTKTRRSVKLQPASVVLEFCGVDFRGASAFTLVLPRIPIVVTVRA